MVPIESLMSLAFAPSMPQHHTATPWGLYALILGAVAALEALYIALRVAGDRGWVVLPFHRGFAASPSRAETGALASHSRVAATDAHPPGPDSGDALLHDKRWLALVEECVLLYDEMDGTSGRLDSSGQAIAVHVCDRLREILERSGVEIISDDATFNRSRHKPETAVSSVPVGAPILETVSPGFAVGRRVLRRANVRTGTASTSSGSTAPR